MKRVAGKEWKRIGRGWRLSISLSSLNPFTNHLLPFQNPRRPNLAPLAPPRNSSSLYEDPAVSPTSLLPFTKNGGSYDKYRDYSKRVYASHEARVEALDKAEKLQSELNSPHPIFIKSMLQSHVTGGFWLGLPVHFCKKNLPRKDEVMTLIDEDENESPTTYLAQKTGLSAGWRGFAIAHKLADGDALIFELVKRTAFKVYIIRVNGPSFRG
ncbi:hypothetical protein RYX36_013771 [Vicia faba]